MRSNVVSMLSQKFADEVCAYLNAQEKYQTELKRKATRQIRIVKPDATDEEVCAMMRCGKDALYRQLILDGGTNDNVLTTCNYVDGKYRDVLTLEQSLHELHQLFLDVAVLTEHQGEMLDTIEHNVELTNDHVENANESIAKSINYLKKIAKKRLWLLIILTIAAVIILAPVLVAVL